MGFDDTVQRLLAESLEEIADPKAKVGRVIIKAVRIARLRSDYENLYWLEIESGATGQRASEVLVEISAHFAIGELKSLRERVLARYFENRTISRLADSSTNEPSILGLPVALIERELLGFEAMIDEATTPKHLHGYDWMAAEEGNVPLRHKLRGVAKDYAEVLERVRHAVFQFLSRSEAHVLSGRVDSDIFDLNRQYVRERLETLDPDIAHQFHSATERVQEDSSESLSQALTTARRILKGLADALFPARREPVVGVDGQERILTDDKFMNRLTQFVVEQLKAGTSRSMLLARMEQYSGRISHLNDLASKGVHAKVSRFEVVQCLQELYMLTGDLLRLQDGTSGSLHPLSGGLDGTAE